MAHRPLVVRVGRIWRPYGGHYPLDGRFKETNDRVGGEIPLTSGPYHRMESESGLPRAPGRVRRAAAAGSVRKRGLVDPGGVTAAPGARCRPPGSPGASAAAAAAA